MSLNSTPTAERLHIAFFGKRNAGKSSLINALTNQEVAIVSSVAGTTTDPVYKSMELLPLGPVMIIDTAGIDDEGALGQMRIKRTHQVLNKTDIAVVVVAGQMGKEEEELISLIQNKNIPYLVVFNKKDLFSYDSFSVSAKTGEGIEELKNKLGSLNVEDNSPPIVKDLLSRGDVVVLVTPIDASAPKGRIILPQQQTIREILDASAVAVTCKESELELTLSSLSEKPKMVICDSQVFDLCDKITPSDVMLTSFSILMARHKGLLCEAVKGIRKIDSLKPTDKVLIAEGCTHHRQCEDIGTVKIPNWLKKHLGFELQIDFSSGASFPEDLEQYALIIHCGGCMLNEREVKYRVKCALDSKTAITNYGIAIAYMRGILDRGVKGII